MYPDSWTVTSPSWLMGHPLNRECFLCLGFWTLLAQRSAVSDNVPISSGPHKNYILWMLQYARNEDFLQEKSGNVGCIGNFFPVLIWPLVLWIATFNVKTSHSPGLLAIWIIPISTLKVSVIGQRSESPGFTEFDEWLSQVIYRLLGLCIIHVVFKGALATMNVCLQTWHVHHIFLI